MVKDDTVLRAIPDVVSSWSTDDIKLRAEDREVVGRSYYYGRVSDFRSGRCRSRPINRRVVECSVNDLAYV
jgi:hypothetical protein